MNRYERLHTGFQHLHFLPKRQIWPRSESRKGRLGGCFISEITAAELKFGAASSDNPAKRKPVIEGFIKKLQILPIYSTLDLYAEEKTRLRKAGNIIDDFDLLIGCTAVFNDLIMVTNNVAHLGRVAGITIEDWTKT